MTGFALAAAASVVVGLSVGVATTVGVTLAVADHGAVRGGPPVPRPLGPHQVQYGDRCFHGHCLP